MDYHFPEEIITTEEKRQYLRNLLQQAPADADHNSTWAAIRIQLEDLDRLSS
jgi:hypothetical protein